MSGEQRPQQRNNVLKSTPRQATGCNKTVTWVKHFYLGYSFVAPLFHPGQLRAHCLRHLLQCCGQSTLTKLYHPDRLTNLSSIPIHTRCTKCHYRYSSDILISPKPTNWLYAADTLTHSQHCNKKAAPQLSHTFAY